MCAIDELNYSDIGKVYTNYISSVYTLLYIMNNTDVRIAVCDSMQSHSTEWPAVVLLFQALNYEEEALFLTPESPLLSVIKSTCILLCYYIPSGGF